MVINEKDAIEAASLRNDHIVVAISQAREQLRQTSLDHRRAVYDIIAEHGPIAPSDVYDQSYRQSPNRSSRQDTLLKLTQYNLLEQHWSRRNRTCTVIE